MNQDVKGLFDSINQSFDPKDEEREYQKRRKIAENYLSYEETIYTGERSKQDSIKKIHDYATIWGVGNALEALVEEILIEPAQDDYDAIVDPDEEPEMVTGENRERVLEMFHEKFDYDSWERNTPKVKKMFNTLVDEMLPQELTDHDLEMVAMRIWDTVWSDIC